MEIEGEKHKNKRTSLKKANVYNPIFSKHPWPFHSDLIFFAEMANFFQMLYTGRIQSTHQINQFKRPTTGIFSFEEYGASDLLPIRSL